MSQRFIGVDGEGVTDPDGTHRYVLLSVGNQSLKVTRGSDHECLSFHEIMPFLWQQYKANPDATFVAFYFQYDLAQWLKGLPYDRAMMLLSPAGLAKRLPTDPRNPIPWPVRHAGWEFDLLGMRRFKLRPEGSSDRWMYICDTGQFWQSSFLKAIDPKGWNEPLVTPREFQQLSTGKASRATASLTRTMVEYNTLENKVLSRLTGRLDMAFRANGWTLHRDAWYGPGQIAQLWLRTIGAPKGKDIQKVTPPEVLSAAIGSYYGGRFEIMRHGMIPGTVWNYDINSAYPDAISKLPCLMHGRWVHNLPNPEGYTLVYARTMGRDTFMGGLPNRNNDGIICYPRGTIGWYWQHELDAATRAGLIYDATIFDSWEYLPCDCPPPLQSIRRLYEQRLQVGKNTAQGKALKLIYNSAYGKFAQSIGNPKFGNPLYASLITSACRTQILDAVATHPLQSNAVAMIATDGIVFTHPHPTLPVSPETLGLWEESQKENLTLFMPGIYWDDATRDSLSTKTMGLKTRGINASEFSKHLDILDDAFGAMHETGEWPTLTIPVQFSVISPTMALHRGRWSDCGKVLTYAHHGTTRSLDSNPQNKRDPESLRAVDGSFASLPYQSRGPSEPYSKRFGLTVEVLIDNDIVTTDGSLNMEIIELLGGEQ